MRPPNGTLMIHVTGMDTAAMRDREMAWLYALASLADSPVQRILLEFLDPWACPKPQNNTFLRQFYGEAKQMFPLPPIVQCRRFRQDRPDGPLKAGGPGTRLYDATEWLDAYKHLHAVCKSLGHNGPTGINCEAHGAGRGIVDLEHCDRVLMREEIVFAKREAIKAGVPVPDISRPGDGRWANAFGWGTGRAGHVGTTETLRASTCVPSESWRQVPSFAGASVRYMVSYIEGVTDTPGSGITAEQYMGMNWGAITDRLSIPATGMRARQVLPECSIVTTDGPGMLGLIDALAEWRCGR